jgi:hypothetical protein
MFFALGANGYLGSICNAGQPAPWNQCSAPVGAVFPANVIMQTADVSYRKVQFVVQYTGVVPKGSPVWDTVAGMCDSTTMTPSPGQLILTCSVDTYQSAIAQVALDFTCTGAPSVNNEIKLIVGLGNGESYIGDEYGARHSDGTYEKSMFVDCIVPQTADMHLEIKGGSASCDSVPEAVSCTVPPAGQFTVAVATDGPPPQGYYGFATEVLYSGLHYLPAPDNLQTIPDPNEGSDVEVVVPARLYAGREPFYSITGAEGYVRHAADTYNNQHYEGNLVVLQMQCDQPGTYTMTLTSLSYPDRRNGSDFWGATNQDNTNSAIRLNSEDTINITCLAPPTPTPTISPTATTTPTASSTRTRVPPELGGVAEPPDLGSGVFGLGASVVVLAVALLILGVGGLALRRRS